MGISIDASALKRTNWYEFVIRFICGGLITVLTGLIAREFGPVLGGLFLAFPAIFPAAASLIEKHKSQKKEPICLDSQKRGRQAAGRDAAGAAIGSVGLLAFAVVVWQMLPGHNAWAVLISATLIWFAISGLIWWLQRCFLKSTGFLDNFT